LTKEVCIINLKIIVREIRFIIDLKRMINDKLRFNLILIMIKSFISL